MSPAIGSLLTVFGLWFTLAVLGCGGSSNYSPAKQIELTSEQRTTINNALRTKGYPAPQKLEIKDSGWLVATFEVRNGLSARSFAENALLAIREVMLPYKTVKNYRVTMNGPSPGTGMIRRYGSARYIEGGSVEWEEGVRGY